MFIKADIEKYFQGEKAESIVFMGIGTASFVAALIFFFVMATAFYKGAAVPMLLIGLLMLVVGFTVFKRSDADRIRNVYAYDMNPSQLKELEIPRMEVVMKNFVMYRYIEIGLALAGLILFFYFKNNADKAFWTGVGFGLLIMSLLALGADYFSENRGVVYLKGLKEFVK